MRIYFDTEFYEDSKTIDLISIGMVREDGKCLYLLNSDCDWRKPYADPWHQKNTIPNLYNFPKYSNGCKGLPEDCYQPGFDVMRKDRGITSLSPTMGDRIIEFLGEPHNETGEHSDLEFWAWYAAYDWVVLCQLFGRMIDLPEGWPMYCRDFKQTVDENPWFTKSEESNDHNAMGDALWLREEHTRFMAGQKVLLDQVVRDSNQGPRRPEGADGPGQA